MTLALTLFSSTPARFDRRQSSVRPRQLLPPSLAAAAARAVAAAATRAVRPSPVRLTHRLSLLLSLAAAAPTEC